MMPIAFVFNRFPRMVRDLAAKMGKKVQLTMQGEGTELDKGLIEKISDPLTHLVRNSVDHGIESCEKRLAAGKPELGTVTLRASHQSGNIVVEVIDDGAGLNRERILAKARERGLPVSDEMSDQDVWMLIFEAGFSPAEVVTDVSGRGVGMDVVKRNIQALGGTVEIDSASGAGTRISVRLPLTLAIMDGMSVAVGNEIYILPLASVIESLQVKEGQVQSVAGRGLVVEVRQDFLPVISLHEVFPTGPAKGDRASGIMVIVEAEGVKSALLVDELVGQHQVVVKSLEANYKRVSGVSGATIMGDGHVALILDVPTLVRRNRSTP
jgi:two-component system chemotaxis sensor kinase CheA